MTESEEKLKLLIAFGRLAANEPNLDKLLILIAEQVGKILQCDRCGVFLIDYEKGQLWSKVAQGIFDSEIRLPVNHGPLGVVVETGQPVNIKNTVNDPRFSSDIDKIIGYKTRNYLAVPLKDNRGKTIGAFQAANKRNGHFTEQDQGLFVLLASVASGAIENSKLYENVKKAQLETIYRLAITAEYRDQKDTARHLKTMSALSHILAVHMKVSAQKAEEIKYASPLHDIGKVGLADSILLKPGKLTPEEYEEMKKHADYGAKILESAESPILQTAYRIAYCHHEKYDGNGYPRKIKGDEIPIEARIVSVADVFDALCMPRVYKPAWGAKRSYEYIVSQSGKAFDPAVVKAFMDAFPVIETLYSEEYIKQFQ